VGFELLSTGWIAAFFANTGEITGGTMIALRATILIAGLIAKQAPAA
jgi:hypothetical protein